MIPYKLSTVIMLLSDRLEEYHQLFDISLWDSNRDKVFNSSPNPGHIFLFMLAIFLLAIVVIGFGFYLWFFVTSSDHTEVRLLNILNAYLSVGCIGGSVTAFFTMLRSGLGYPESSLEHILVGFHMVAMTALFLLISIATLINQFKPKVYLDLSVAWKHSMALPIILLFCIIIDALIVYYCCLSLENECIKIKIRKFVLLPAPCICFILQSIVIIDDIWGFNNIIKYVIPPNQTPVTNFENPALGLQYHVVCIISKTKGCLNNKINNNSGIYLNFDWVLHPLPI